MARGFGMSPSREFHDAAAEPGHAAHVGEQAVRGQVGVTGAERQPDPDPVRLETDPGAEVGEAFQGQQRVGRLALPPQRPGQRAEPEPGGQQQAAAQRRAGGQRDRGPLPGQGLR